MPHEFMPSDLIPPDLKDGAEEFIDDFRNQWISLVETSAQAGKRPMMIFLPTQGDPLLVGRIQVREPHLLRIDGAPISDPTSVTIIYAHYNTLQLMIKFMDAPLPAPDAPELPRHKGIGFDVNFINSAKQEVEVG